MISLWEIFWIVCMLALVIAVSVAAFRENKAQAKARQGLAMQTQAVDQQLDENLQDGFGESDPMDAFGNEGADPFGNLDEKAFR